MAKNERETIAVPMEMSIPDSLSTKYATNMVVQHTEHEFIIFFFEVQPPLVIGTPEEQKEALQKIFKPIREHIKLNKCTRAILVGHNAFFDLGFINAAVERTKLKNNPFHPFSNFDTVTLGALAYSQTVLSRIAEAADIEWDNSSAHSAVYDAEKTAAVFCDVMNKWQLLQA